MPAETIFHLPDGWMLKELLTLEQVEAIRPVWQALQDQEPRPILESDPDRYLAVLKGDSALCPCVFLLYREDHVQAMLVGRLGTEVLPIRLGYKVILNPKLKCFSVVYGGLLGRPDERVSAILLNSLAEVLKRRHVDCISFNHLPADCTFYRQIRRNVPFLCRNHFSATDLHWRMARPATLDAFFQQLSKKHRANLRRSIRNFEEENEGSVRLVRSEEKTDMDRLSRDAETVSAKTYQHGLGAGYYNSPLTRSILETDARLNRRRFSLIYIADQPCAFQWGTVLRDTYFLEMIGYDPQWTQQGIGNILFIKELEPLCSMDAVQYIDFGFGDAQYKRSYGNESWPEVKKTYVFARRLRPLLVNALISLNGALTLGLTWIVRKVGIYAWIKRVWRGRLKKPSSDS
jgi:CelD/BcsL family acetyltransferase involved in cellulose biosynthesis